MSIDRLLLSNFKAFGSTLQSVPIRPITLVFGPNSSGKSSLLHSLLWLAEGILRGNLDVQEPAAGKGIQLGGFDQIHHRHDLEKMPVIGWTILGKTLEAGIGGWNKFDSFTLEMGIRRVNRKVGPAFVSISSASTVFFKAEAASTGIWTLSLLDWSHPALQAVITASGGLSPDRRAQIEAQAPADQLEVIFQSMLPSRLKPVGSSNEWVFDKGLPEVFRGLFDAFRESIVPMLSQFACVPPLRLLPERDFDPLRSDEVWQRLATDATVRETLNQWLSDPELFHNPYRLEVLRFLREDAIQRELPRVIRGSITDWLARMDRDYATSFDGHEITFAYNDAMDRFFAGPVRSYARRCENFWTEWLNNEIIKYNVEDVYGSRLSSMNAEEKQAAKEEWADHLMEDRDIFLSCLLICEPFELFLREDPKIQQLVSKYLDEPYGAKRLFEQIGTSSTTSRATMVLRDLRSQTLVAFQDVGVGISQVIPVVANAIGLKESLISIEQPEIHIHPRLQAELGDVFIESALGENQNTFLLETHSEHLILRILRRIRETTRGTLPDGHHPIRPEDVAVLYVEPGAEGAVVRELRVNEQGRFIDEWPNGFFEDRLDELI